MSASILSTRRDGPEQVESRVSGWLTMPCWSCGTDVDEDDLHCRRCGARLHPGPGEAAPVVDPVVDPTLPPPPPPPPPAIEVWDPGPANRSAGSAPPGYDLGAARTRGATPSSTDSSTGKGRPNWPLIGGVIALAIVFIVGLIVVGRPRSSPPTAEELSAATSTVPPSTLPSSFPPPPSVPIPPGGLTAEQVGQSFGDAVYRVDVEGCGITGSGSAFAISPYHLVTNWHVVVPDTEPTVVARDGTKRAGHVIGMSQHPDVAVIKLDEPVTDYLEWAPTGSLTEGQDLVALGYPLPALDYTLTKLTISSFETAGEVRTGIRADGHIDRGNSGGPSLTTDGKVAGVNTAVNVNIGAPTGPITGDGFQVVPYIGSADSLKPVVDGYLTSGDTKTVPPDCSKVTLDQAKAFGDNAELDAIWGLCDRGDSAACDTLTANTQPGTEYYKFGVTCGGRETVRGYCYWRWGPTLPPK